MTARWEAKFRAEARHANERSLHRYLRHERRRSFMWGALAGGGLVFVCLVWTVRLVAR